jgi:6-phosphofructokinase 1
LKSFFLVVIYNQQNNNNNMTSTNDKLQFKVAIFTSGGDSSGMNAAVRACVRQCLERGAEAYCVQDGFSGLYKGDFTRMEWSDVGGILHRGGTICGTARCKEFRELSGRRQSAFHLVCS